MIGTVASVTGLFLGLLLAKGLFSFFNSIGFTLPNSGIVFGTRTVIISLLVGIVVTLVASLRPAVRATRVPPIAAVREGSTLPPGRFARFRTPGSLDRDRARLRGSDLRALQRPALRQAPRDDRRARLDGARCAARLHRHLARLGALRPPARLVDRASGPVAAHDPLARLPVPHRRSAGSTSPITASGTRPGRRSSTARRRQSLPATTHGETRSARRRPPPR